MFLDAIATQLSDHYNCLHIEMIYEFLFVCYVCLFVCLSSEIELIYKAQGIWRYLIEETMIF